MDVAYDHTFTDDAVTADKKGKAPTREQEGEQQEESLNEELQEAYKAISNSPWGARLGAFVGTVRKQGESYYETARKEYAVHAVKGFGDLRTNIVARTRALSLGEAKNGGDGVLQKIKKGVAEIEAAEARADEYLAKFGSSIGGFLRDAITISPPANGEEEVVMQTGEDKKKQIFTTRLDAQLHLLHSNLELFRTDPKVESFETFGDTFSVEEQTDKIASDLERYPELRASMEKLVPDEVEYKAFWIRYYFLRNELDQEEKKRKELLKGATLDEEEVGWDEDDSEDDEEDDSEDEDEEEEEVDDEKKVSTTKQPVTKASTDTLQPATKPKQTDRSSQPDSEASYDVVSGAPSKTPSQSAGSPPKSKAKEVESSDEEADWE